MRARLELAGGPPWARCLPDQARPDQHRGVAPRQDRTGAANGSELAGEGRGAWTQGGASRSEFAATRRATGTGELRETWEGGLPSRRAGRHGLAWPC